MHVTCKCHSCGTLVHEMHVIVRNITFLVKPSKCEISEGNISSKKCFIFSEKSFTFQKCCKKCSIFSFISSIFLQFLALFRRNVSKMWEKWLKCPLFRPKCGKNRPSNRRLGHFSGSCGHYTWANWGLTGPLGQLRPQCGAFRPEQQAILRPQATLGLLWPLKGQHRWLQVGVSENSNSLFAYICILHV